MNSVERAGAKTRFIHRFGPGFGGNGGKPGCKLGISRPKRCAQLGIRVWITPSRSCDPQAGRNSCCDELQAKVIPVPCAPGSRAVLGGEAQTHWVETTKPRAI